MAGPSVPVQGRVVQHIPISGPSAPIAGPSRPVQDRVDWNSRFQQGFQARHNQWRQNCSHTPANQIHSGVMEPQVDIQRQQGYADEEQQHTAHLAALQQQEEQVALQHIADLRWQRDKQIEREQLAHLAELRWQHEQQELQRTIEAEQHQA